MDRKSSKKYTIALNIYYLMLCIIFSLSTSCERAGKTVNYKKENNLIDTLYFKGKIVHSNHINANSGVLVISIDSSNVLSYEGIYDSKDDIGLGFISSDTAYIITEGYDRIVHSDGIIFRNGWWLFNGYSDSLEYWPVNNIVGTLDKSKRFISTYRGDGVFQHRHYLGDYVIIVWFPIILFILSAVAFRILKIKI